MWGRWGAVFTFAFQKDQSSCNTMDRDKTLGLKTNGATAVLLVRNDGTEIYHKLSLLISAFFCLMNK